VYYVDSNVLVSYVFSTDEPYHTASQRLLEELILKRRQKLYAPSLTLVVVSALATEGSLRRGRSLWSKPFSLRECRNS